MKSNNVPVGGVGSNHNAKRCILHVRDLPGKDEDRCTPGGEFCIAGKGFGDWDEVPLDLGVWLNASGGGGLVRVQHYTSWSDDCITGYWPSELRGPQWV